MQWLSKFAASIVECNNDAVHWAKDNSYIDKNRVQRYSKKFAYQSVSYMFNCMQNFPKYRIYYENTQPDQNLCFMLDVDYKYGKDGDMTADECMQSLTEHIIPAVHVAAKAAGISTIHPHQLFSSCRQDKFSYHVHFPSYYFENRNIMSFFAQLVWDHLHINGATLIPDPAIYGSGARQFRVAYCFKLGKPDSAKVLIGPGGEKVQWDSVDLEVFTSMLVSTRWENVPVISSLDGYNPGVKSGQPTLGVRKKTPRASSAIRPPRQTCDTDITEPKRSKVVKALGIFHVANDIEGWNINKVNSVRGDDSQIDVRITTVGWDTPTMCFAKEVHKSNCIMYTLDGHTYEIKRSYCFGCKEVVYRATCRINPQTDCCTESHMGSVVSHQCGDGHHDLYHTLGTKMEFAKVSGRMATDVVGDKVYHSETLFRDLCDHITELLTDKDTDVKYVTFFLLGSKGSGKTTILRKLLEFYEKLSPKARMLVHTSRCALASQLKETLSESDTLDFCHYKDVKNPSDYMKLILQVESTKKLFKGNLAVKYDVLVVDELMAHLKQILSALMKPQEQQRVLAYFSHLIRNARLLICMCADTQEDDPIYNFIINERRKGKTDESHALQVFKVTSPASGLRIFIEDPEAVQAAACDALDRQGNVWFFSNSRKSVRRLADIILERAREAKDTEMFNGVLVVSGNKHDISDNAKKAVFEKRVTKHVPSMIMTESGDVVANDNNTVFPVRIFMFTPTITHGFSFSDEAGYFTAFMSIAVASDVPARDLLQQSGRNRNCKALLLGVKQVKSKDADADDADDATVININKDIILRDTEDWTTPKAWTLQDEDLEQFSEDSNTGRNQLNEFYEKEVIASKNNFVGEINRLCNNHSTDHLFIAPFIDGYRHAHGDLMSEYHSWGKLKNEAERASSLVEEPIARKPPSFSPEWYYKEAKRLCGTVLQNSPKTIVMALSMQYVIELLSHVMSPTWDLENDNVVVFKNILLLYGLGKPDAPASVDDILGFMSPMKDFDVMALQDFSKYEKIYRIVYQHDAKQLKKLTAIRSEWPDLTERGKAMKWNSLSNAWVKRHFEKLMCMKTKRKRNNQYKLHICWPFKTDLFKTVVEWSIRCSQTVQSRNITCLTEDQMPDIATEKMKWIQNHLLSINEQLENDTKETTRATPKVNSMAAIARLAFNGEVGLGETLNHDDYQKHKRKSDLLFCNTFIVVKKPKT